MNTILIIDDDEKLRTLVSSTLEDEGYDIRQAANGEQGIAMVRSDQPEIIICDIHMEAMSGFDVLREVRKDPSSSTIPFIFLTGMGGRSNFRQGMELGADDYIEKPFTTEELLASVRSRLRVRSIIRQESAQRLESLRSSITHALPHEFRTPLTAMTPARYAAMQTRPPADCGSRRRGRLGSRRSPPR